MSNVLEKTALSETGRAFATPIIGGVAAAGVAYGLPAAIDKIREVRVRRNRDEYINEMKKVFPDLKSVPKKDLHVAYNSIAMHSPHVLRDPLLGGQTLKSMANYRQADVTALNEINKLRGNNMMDQAILNATNAVSGGIAEGFKGYHTQRQSDAEQAYREKMDTHRVGMDNARAALEANKFQYAKDRDGVRDGYQKDRDAKSDARDEMRDARALSTERTRRRDERRRHKTQRKDLLYKRQERKDKADLEDAKSHYIALDSDRKDRRDEELVEKHDAWVRAGRPAQATYAGPKPERVKFNLMNPRRRKGRGRKVKTASYNNGLLDIVSMLRDRNI